jgi:hypothetical protein
MYLRLAPTMGRPRLNIREHSQALHLCLRTGLSNCRAHESRIEIRKSILFAQPLEISEPAKHSTEPGKLSGAFI